MKQFFKQCWCALHGHGEIYWEGSRHTLATCKRCGARVRLDL